MSAILAGLRDKRGWWFDVAVFAAGMAALAGATAAAVQHGEGIHLPMLVAVPVIVVVARFPMVIDSSDGGIEVGFDSTVLMFLLCTIDAHDALLLWSAGVILTQVLSGKKLGSVLFNIGVGIFAGALAALVLDQVRGDSTGTVAELAGVALGAAAYFATDYIVSAVSIAMSSRTEVRGHLLQPSTLVAICCFVPFDTLGYLGAVVHRVAPWWTELLFTVPLVTLLIATRALSRGRENARRLGVLFDAAVKAQTLAGREAVTEALLGDARKLLYVRDVELRLAPPSRHEIGAQIDCGDESRWLVTAALGRARSTIAADVYALQALAAVASDAFARLALTEEMVHVARHDPLTDLPNRGILQDRLAHALDLARRRGTQVALLFIDLDGFKPVNDRFGHAAGDAVLVTLAERLQRCVRESDTVARLGGDEFAILFEDVEPQEISEVCGRVLAAVEEGAVIAGQQVPLSASAGIAYSGIDETAERLLRKADMAMYEAKDRGKARVVAYEEAIGRSRIERLELVDELRRAIERDEIEVVYQPIVAAVTGRVVGVEALARWSRATGAVSPETFIRIAEETGQIGALGERVLARAVSDTAKVCDVACPGFLVSVNISAQQLRDPSFVESVRRAVGAMDALLVLEITEREGLDIDEVVLGAMREIVAMGVRFAIDDFGVGFSSISYLQNLPVQVVKADALLSRGIDTDERARNLLKSVMLMGRTLGLSIVIEGIERAGQLAVLREDDPEVYAQGYWLYRPMPLGSLREVLSASRTGRKRSVEPQAAIRSSA